MYLMRWTFMISSITKWAIFNNVEGKSGTYTHSEYYNFATVLQVLSLEESQFADLLLFVHIWGLVIFVWDNTQNVHVHHSVYWLKWLGRNLIISKW